MKFETGIFTEFVRYVKQDWMVFCAAIILCVGTVFLEAFLDAGNIEFLSTPIFAFIAIRVHKIILRDRIENLKPYDGYMMLAYAWRLIVLLLMSAFLSILIIQMLGDLRQGTKLLAIMLSLGLIYGLFLSTFGTIFPAIVTNFDATFSAASNRTAKTFKYVLLRMFLFIGPLAAISFSVNTYLTVKYKVGYVIAPNGDFSLFSTALYFFDSMTSLSITVLASVVLSRAFLISGNFEGRANR